MSSRGCVESVEEARWGRYLPTEADQGAQTGSISDTEKNSGEIGKQLLEPLFPVQGAFFRNGLQRLCWLGRDRGERVASRRRVWPVAGKILRLGKFGRDRNRRFGVPGALPKGALVETNLRVKELSGTVPALRASPEGDRWRSPSISVFFALPHQVRDGRISRASNHGVKSWGRKIIRTMEGAVLALPKNSALAGE